MRLLLLMGILFFSVSGNSQSGFKIFYETDLSDIPLIINGRFVKRPIYATSFFIKGKNDKNGKHFKSLLLVKYKNN